MKISPIDQDYQGRNQYRSICALPYASRGFFLSGNQAISQGEDNSDEDVNSGKANSHPKQDAYEEGQSGLGGNDLSFPGHPEKANRDNTFLDVR